MTPAPTAVDENHFGWPPQMGLGCTAEGRHTQVEKIGRKRLESGHGWSANLLHNDPFVIVQVH